MLTICIPCGYICEGEESFGSLLENWCCPDCGASIKNFAHIDESLPEKEDELLFSGSRDKPSIMS